MFGVPHLPQKFQYQSDNCLGLLTSQNIPYQPCIHTLAHSSRKVPTHLPYPLGTPPTERYSSCLLCGQRFLKRNIKLLALHLKQQHPHQWNVALEGVLRAEKNDHHYLTPKTQPSYGSVPSPPHIYESIDTPLQVRGLFVSVNKLENEYFSEY